MTRAKELLQRLYEFDPATIALGATLGVANIGYQAFAAKKRREDKIAQAGMGQEHQDAKTELKNLHKQHVAFGGKQPALTHKVNVQKMKLRDIENRGLAKYQQGLAHDPEKKATAQHT